MLKERRFDTVDGRNKFLKDITGHVKRGFLELHREVKGPLKDVWIEEGYFEGDKYGIANINNKVKLFFKWTSYMRDKILLTHKYNVAARISANDSVITCLYNQIFEYSSVSLNMLSNLLRKRDNYN